MGKINLQTIRLIRRRQTYEARELSIKLGVHIQTVRTWRKAGLAPIDLESWPSLYLGDTVRAFLRAEIIKTKQKLQPEEFYCLKCRNATTSNLSDIRVEATGQKIGKSDVQVIIHGNCRQCGSKCRRLSTVRKAQETHHPGKVLWLAESSLILLQSSNLNTHVERSSEDET